VAFPGAGAGGALRIDPPGAARAWLRRLHARTTAEQAVAEGLGGDLAADAEGRERVAEEGVRIAGHEGGGGGLGG
jgi:hypothetical protein